MRISSGDPMNFLNRPIGCGLLIAVLALVAMVTLPNNRARREKAFEEN